MANVGPRGSQVAANVRGSTSSPAQGTGLTGGDGKHDSSSGTLSQSQSHFFHGREHNLSKDDTGSNKEDSLVQSQTNGLRQSVAFGPECMPQPVVTFEIKDHEILKKQDYVVSIQKSKAAQQVLIQLMINLMLKTFFGD